MFRRAPSRPALTSVATRSSDLWAIGCTVYFMVAGTPAFAAINDYQSFRKIEALDYTFPEGFYDAAKDLIQRLVVRSNEPLCIAFVERDTGARTVRSPRRGT